MNMITTRLEFKRQVLPALMISYDMFLTEEYNDVHEILKIDGVHGIADYYLEVRGVFDRVFGRHDVHPNFDEYYKPYIDQGVMADPDTLFYAYMKDLLTRVDPEDDKGFEYDLRQIEFMVNNAVKDYDDSDIYPFEFDHCRDEDTMYTMTQMIPVPHEHFDRQDMDDYFELEKLNEAARVAHNKIAIKSFIRTMMLGDEEEPEYSLDDMTFLITNIKGLY